MFFILLLDSDTPRCSVEERDGPLGARRRRSRGGVGARRRRRHPGKTVFHSSSSSLTEPEGRAIIRISQVILDFIRFALSTNFVCVDVRGQRVYQGKVDELD